MVNRIFGKPLAADPLMGRQRMEMTMKMQEVYAPLGQILKLMSDKGVTSKRLTLLIKTGILADLLDPEADLSVTRRAAIREALRMEPLGKPRLGELVMDMCFHGMDSDNEAHSLVLLLIERILKISLFELAGNLDALSEALTALRLLPIKNRLRRAGIVPESSALDRDQEGMLTQLVQYIRSYYLLCKLRSIEHVSDWSVSFLDILPWDLESEEEGKSVILELFRDTKFADPRDARLLLDRCGIKFTEDDLKTYF